MALQQINWLQIDTQKVPSGSSIILGGTGSNYLEAVYAKNLGLSGSVIISGSLDTSGDVVIGGSLTVKGTTTIVDSTTVSIGDNIIALNGTAAAFGGIQVNDPTNPSKISGSLLWDSANDVWIAGPSGSELEVVLIDKFNQFTSSVSQSFNASDIWQETGSFYATSHDLQLTGSMVIKGDLRVEGTTTLIKNDSNLESLIVSGAMKIVNNQFKSASLAIQNLGTWADRSQNQVIDCGDSFF
jgi:cytoskeletal protein CcmA (bactofilin family)